MCRPLVGQPGWRSRVTVLTGLALLIGACRGDAPPPAWTVAPVLEAVTAEAELTDLMADVTVTQTYRNPHETPIEAVYTFPLPVDGVLLDVEAVLGERRLAGTVVEKTDAKCPAPQLR
jgi:hypothetical protein